jgi:hypothetical protein
MVLGIYLILLFMIHFIDCWRVTARRDRHPGFFEERIAIRPYDRTFIIMDFWPGRQGEMEIPRASGFSFAPLIQNPTYSSW